MMAVMDWRVAFLCCEVFFITQCAGLSGVPPPQNVKVRSSVLTWEYPKQYTNVSYTVQYNTTLYEWHELYVGRQQQFNFTETAEDFYGKTFRVRSERENQTSDWVCSRLVQCAQLHTCAPLIDLKVEPDKVYLWMRHRDQSLKEIEGGHIIFKPLYWKRNSTDNKQEAIVNSAHLILDDLEPGQEYCFQVEFLLFHKTYGRPSREICEVMKETSKQRMLRVAFTGVLTVAGLAALGVCLYYVHTRRKSIKALLKPPLEIPYHIEEFFFSEFPLHPVTHPSSQETESFELVSCVDESANEEDRCDLEQDKENVNSPQCVCSVLSQGL